MKPILPRWNLTDLYSDMYCPELSEDFTKAKELSSSFADKYKGNLANLSSENFAIAIKEYEEFNEIIGKIMSYAQLLHAGDVSDPKIGRFYQNAQERITDISTITLFFTLEINRLSVDEVNEKLSSAEAALYKSWVDSIRLFCDYQLSDDLEQILHEKDIVCSGAWNRLFDETLAGLRFELEGLPAPCCAAGASVNAENDNGNIDADGVEASEAAKAEMAAMQDAGFDTEAKPLSIAEVLDKLSDKNEDVRRIAAKALGKTLGDNIRLFSHITNTLAKDKQIDDTWRKYPSSISSRNLSNQIEDEVVEALASTVKNNYENLAHRYYALKAKWMGKDKLEYWDRNAPLPDSDTKEYSWQDAKDIVSSAYSRFSKDMATIGQQFFDNNWIDVPQREGKDSGAFAHPTVPSAHPYLLLNFMGKTRDVMTLAHELGHGVHQVLSAKQGYLMSDTPLTLAETASVFGEMLTFRSMLDSETDPVRKKNMLAGKVEDMLNTVVRQIAFHEFEAAVHEERNKGEVPVERLCDIWMDVQSRSLGPAVNFDDEYKYYWTYIPHFIHTPFYVYAYAFGDCLVNSLYGVYLENGVDDFQEKYMEMLKAGGTLKHKELLAPFGLDASRPDFWEKGISVVSGFIDELEAIDKA
ncbi:MAG: M3 family oligoendopeptidase [Alphaproteobacteria bacterium]|nr:M3 family oligoendopeptidase [Alphaproteobacteria bacterium]